MPGGYWVDDGLCSRLKTRCFPGLQGVLVHIYCGSLTPFLCCRDGDPAGVLSGGLGCCSSCGEEFFLWDGVFGEY